MHGQPHIGYTNVELIKAEEGGTYSYHSYFKGEGFSEGFS